jgi:hypothetical protein
MNIKGKWTNEAMDDNMYVVENGTTSLWKGVGTKTYTLSNNHLYEKTRSKKLGLMGVLIVKEN